MRRITASRSAKAQDAGSLTLQPAGDHFSTLTGRIDGDLTGSIVLQQDAAEGGTVDFAIAGDAAGSITIPRIAGIGTMPGRLDVSGDLSGTINVQTMHDATVVLHRISGSLQIDTMEAGRIIQFGPVTSTAVITIGDMSSIGSSFSETLFTLNSGNFDFDGRLVLQNGVPADQAVIVHGPLTTGAKIDLKNGNVAGIFQVFGGGGGDIINGGAVTATGEVTLAGGNLSL